MGEGDFTFTLAFAVLREQVLKDVLRERYASFEELFATLDLGSSEPRVWRGIISTRYEPEPEFGPKPKPVPYFEEVQLKCIESAASYSRLQIEKKETKHH